MPIKTENFTDEKLEELFKEQRREYGLIDTIMMIGPSDEDVQAMIESSLTKQIEPQVQCMYPSKNRKLNVDQYTTLELINQAYINNYSVKDSRTKPPLRRNQSY